MSASTIHHPLVNFFGLGIKEQKMKTIAELEAELKELMKLPDVAETRAAVQALRWVCDDTLTMQPASQLLRGDISF